MQPPNGIDMQSIQEAIMRRSQGGGGTPPTQQMSVPQGQLPTGGAAMPQPGMAPPIPQGVQQNVAPGGQGSPVSPEGAAVAKAKSGMTLDDDGKGIAKQLINKLMQVM